MSGVRRLGLRLRAAWNVLRGRPTIAFCDFVADPNSVLCLRGHPHALVLDSTFTGGKGGLRVLDY